MLGGIWAEFRRALVASIGRPRTRLGRRRRERYGISLRHEYLEARELLSVNTISFDAKSSQVVIRGTTDADNVVVTSNVAGSIHVRAESPDGVVEADFLKADVTSIRFDGIDGDDRFENRTSIACHANGGDGNDTLIGGGGNDFLRGGSGDDLLLGGDGDDSIYGGDGNDQLDGQVGNDQIYGEAGHDVLTGGTGNDLLVGGIGDDTLLGGSGDDELSGGDGNDYLSGHEGNDSIRGGSGNDRALGGSGDDVIYGGDGDDELIGGDGHDELYGESGRDRLVGDVGNDVLVGGIDGDVLLGGAGDDSLSGGDGDDYLSGHDGNDSAWGGNGNDRILGGSGNDVVYGGDGDDELLGGDDNDQLYGEAGNDTLVGDAGIDLLVGGYGNDRLLGGSGDDQLNGGEDSDYLSGHEGKDVLNGGAGADRALGGSGDDELIGGEGDDELIGGDGNDRLVGELGNDTLLGGAGNDVLLGGDGNDRLYGEDDNDYLNGHSGDNTLFGGSGDDKLIGNDGYNLLFGNAGNDTITGGSGNNVLVGGAGDDQLIGGNGREILIGGEGADQLNGADGDDLLIGGSTAYDANTVRLNELFSAWSSTDSYAARLATIEDEGFVARLKLQETVFDDAVADTLFGKDGDDWFFLTGTMAVYDPNSAGHHDAPGHSHGTVVDEIPALEGFALIDSLDRVSDRVATETLTTSIPHANDALLQGEHLALFELVRYDQVTHYAVQSGAWNDPSTWHDGEVPANGARVLVPIGIHVQVNGLVSARIVTIRVDGTLSFATNVNTELKVDTIIVGGTGAFEMGTAAAPIAPDVRARLLITDNGAIDRAVDPFAIGRGLISHGRVTMHGAAVLPSSTLLTPPLAGATAVLLDQPATGWKVGDMITFAGTTVGTEQNETRIVRAVVGSIVYLNTALSYDHVPISPEFKVHVVNLTRNAVIESESTATDRRGHVMFMHNPNVDIAYAGFYRLGRTDKLQPINDPVVDANWQLQAGTGSNGRARYSVHFHRAGTTLNGDPATIRGSAVVDSPGWGFVNHSSYVDIVDNVAVAVRGAAFTTEVGDEIGSFVGNVAIGTSGSGETLESRKQIQDFGHQGDGFWFQGTGITVKDNVAAGNDGSAFIYFARALTEAGVKQMFLAANLANPEIANGAAEVHVGEVPILLFENNVGYASSLGLSVWYVMESAQHGVQSVLSDSQFWNNTNGVELPYTRQTVLENLRIVDGADTSTGIGVRSNTVTRDIIFRNLTVIGFNRGIMVPRRGYSVVEGGTFNNLHDIFIMSGLSLNRTVFVTGQAVPPRVTMSAIYRDVDGSVSQFFAPDSVILNYGPFANQRAYYDLQHPDAIPFPKAVAGVPSDYIGLTSQQLWDQYGVAVSGGLAPANAVTSPLVLGGLLVP